MGAVSGTNVGITAVARWHKVGSLCDVHRQQPLTIYQAQVLGVGRSSAGLQSRHGTARRRRMRYNNGIVVGPMEVCHTPREHKASSPTSDRAFDSARIASTILLSCALLGALRFPLQSGRLASLSAQGAVSVAHAGVGEAFKGGWAGLWAGALHTLCGPDHLAGLTPLTLGQSQSTAAVMGALWGFGHSTGQLLLGLAFMVLKERFHGIVPVLSKWSGTIVGFTLIAIGLLGMYESWFAHHEAMPEPVAFAGASRENSSSSMLAVQRGFGTYMIGFVYGLHPDALFVVLPALALPTRMGAFMYISMFVVGTVTAMGGYSLMIGTASGAAAKDRPLLLRHLSTIAGGLAILVGLVVLLSGFGFELPT